MKNKRQHLGNFNKDIKCYGELKGGEEPTLSKFVVCRTSPDKNNNCLTSDAVYKTLALKGCFYKMPLNILCFYS